MVDFFYNFEYDFEMSDTGHDFDFVSEQPPEKTLYYHSGVAAALRDAQKLPEARVSLRHSLDSVAWDDAQRAQLLGQLIRVLVGSVVAAGLCSLTIC